MKYGHIERAEFIERPNRFIAKVRLNDEIETVHVKNTGRCREIFVEGARVLLELADNPNRKTRYSIIGAYKGDMLINTDAHIPNKVVYDAILDGKIDEIKDIDLLKREVTFANSRFDLYFEKGLKKGFIEVKGVTLEDNGICKFPDAPTDRGRKHIRELIKAKEEGYMAYIFFLIQMEDTNYFTPNYEMDPKFGEALLEAQDSGVDILVYDSIVKEDEIIIGKKLDYKL